MSAGRGVAGGNRMANPIGAVCEKARRSLDSYLDGELDDEAPEVRRHFESCSACAAAAEERKRLSRVVRRAVRRGAAPESLSMRIREAIRRD
jgi:anti-sigma factor (TIGR02949 family)